MTKRTQVLSASIALVLLGGVLTGCSTDAAAKPGTGASSSASAPSTAAPSMSSATAGSTSATASTSTSATASSTSASSSSAATNSISTSPAPTWSPPSAEEQAKAIADGEKLGFRVKYQDPSLFPPRPALPPVALMPEAGFSNTEEGAILTIRFFFDSLYYMANGGSTDTFKKVSSTNCLTCTTLSSTFDAMLTKKAYSISSQPRVSDLEVLGKNSAGILHLEGKVEFKPYKSYFPAVGGTTESPDQSGLWEFYLSYHSEGHWIVESAGPA